MDILKRHVPIDMEPFSPHASAVPAKYGLPEEIAFCPRCLISNQRPNSAVEYRHTKNTAKATIRFGEDGVCDACKAADIKHGAIDWEDRRRQLSELCDRYRRNDGRHDCVVPGSGGKDSFYAAYVLKYEFGMHPLTVTWAPHIYTDWGWRNFQKWIHAGFDNILVTPNGRVHRLLSRLATEVLFHPFQPFILGQKNVAPMQAILHDIPLVVYGENEAEYGNPVQDNETALRDWSYFVAKDDSETYLTGISLADLKHRFGVDGSDLELYLPVDPNRLVEKQVEVHYLGYYLKWHPQSCYYHAVKHGDFEAAPERTQGTYSKYNSIDDKIDDLHYYTTFIKFGIGRATYDASQELRSLDIDRDEAMALIRRFDGEFPDRFIHEAFQYLSIDPQAFPEASKMFESPGMDMDYFMHLADRFRSPHLWKHENGEWSLRRAVWQENA